MNFDLDALIGELPELTPPPDLDAMILDMVANTAQDDAPVAQSATPADLVDMPAPANRRWMWLAGPAALAAAALLAAFLIVPSQTGIGDPADWTPRGELGAGPGVDLSMAVETPNGAERFEREHAYQAGDTLMFRVNAHAEGTVYLVRVDDLGVELLHEQPMTAGSADLLTDGQLVGYALESGEGAAVFAVVRTDSPIDPSDLVEGLAVQPDVSKVCAAAHALGGRCSAERVEAVQ